MNAGDQLAIKRFTAIYGNPKPGPQGLCGPTGAPGLQGRASNTGATGSAGSVGPTGSVGLTGAQGQMGYSSGQILYLNNSQTSNSYNIADVNATTQNESYVSKFMTDNIILLANFITPINFPSSTVIPPGIFNFVIEAQQVVATTATASSSIYAQIYRYRPSDISNNEILLFTSENSPMLINNVKRQLSFNCVVNTPYTDLQTSDRLLIKFYGKLINGDEDTELLLYFEGNSMYSHVHTPFSTVGLVGPTGSQGPVGLSQTINLSIIPTDLSLQSTTINVDPAQNGSMYVIRTDSLLTTLTVVVASSLNQSLYYNIKNYSSNDINVLLQIDTNESIPVNSTTPGLPTGVLSKGVVQMLFWNGKTMCLV